MQYREHLNIGKYARQPFAVFLQQNKILKRLAEQSGLTPMDHIASLFGADTFDEELSQYKADQLLDFFIRKLGPAVYNQAIQDARGFMQSKIDDLDAVFYEREDLRDGV